MNHHKQPNLLKESKDFTSHLEIELKTSKERESHKNFDRPEKSPITRLFNTKSDSEFKQDNRPSDKQIRQKSKRLRSLFQQCKLNSAKSSTMVNYGNTDDLPRITAIPHI